MKKIQYYFSSKSPWTYLGHERMLEMARRHGALVEPRPMELAKVFPLSGGLPLDKRPRQRQAYRLTELKRWSQHLGIALNVQPRFFPVDETDASKMIATVAQGGDVDGALKLAGALLRAVWAEERNIADAATLIQVADDCGLDGAALHAGREAGAAPYERWTNDAIELQVFGAPWYVYHGESFWGQDRLDFLERALAAD
jgi:2-hydroxychromene-2-carboxylate isomerase